MSYQASSPDEIALVQWTERMGLTLVHRELNNSMQLRSPTNDLLTYKILEVCIFSHSFDWLAEHFFYALVVFRR